MDGLLAVLTRATRVLTDLRHPFVRSEPFAHPVPPTGAVSGTRFVLPDGREVTFAVSMDGEHTRARADVEGDVLLELPPTDHLDAAADYAAQLAQAAFRIVDNLLDDIV